MCLIWKLKPLYYYFSGYFFFRSLSFSFARTFNFIFQFIFSCLHYLTPQFWFWDLPLITLFHLFFALTHFLAKTIYSKNSRKFGAWKNIFPPSYLCETKKNVVHHVIKWEHCSYFLLVQFCIICFNTRRYLPKYVYKKEFLFIIAKEVILRINNVQNYY